MRHKLRMPPSHSVPSSLCLPHCAFLGVISLVCRHRMRAARYVRGSRLLIVSWSQPCPRGCGRSLLSVGRRIGGPVFVLAIA
jgi:hypothetical protein